MSDIKFVTPFTTSCTHHLRILGALRQKPAAVHGPLPVLRVPVRVDTDVSEIIQENDRKLAKSEGGAAAEGVKTADSDLATIDEAGNDAEADEKPATYVDLGLFQPRNRLEQVTTVFLQDFPALRPKHVHRVFELFLLACPLEGGRTFVFSVMAEPINDTRGVFVRFPAVETTRWAKLAATKAFPGITAVFDEYLETLPQTESPGPVDLSSVAQSIGSILGNKTLYSRGLGRSGTEDLDEVMQYYKTYKVENSELVEVPKELKEVIVKDIIKFRAKVLTIERDVRKKEIEKERRKAKARLTLIFEGIRASKGESGDSESTEKAEKIDNTDGTEEQNPLDLMTDAEYEVHLEEEARKQQQSAYDAAYQALRNVEKSEKSVLLERLHAGRSYEQNLIENKLQYMDEFKTVQEIDGLGLKKELAGSGLRPKLALYYTNRGEYLRLRNHERTREEAMDDADRAAEKESAPVPVAQKPAVKSAAPEKSEEKTPLEPPAQNTETRQNVIVSLFSEADLAAVKEKIGALIEEFLGIREDLLIDLIYDFVLENNLARGEDLVAELQETLDEDSRTLVDQLHEYIAAL